MVSSLNICMSSYWWWTHYIMSQGRGWSGRVKGSFLAVNCRGNVDGNFRYGCWLQKRQIFGWEILLGKSVDPFVFKQPHKHILEQVPWCITVPRKQIRSRASLLLHIDGGTGADQLHAPRPHIVRFPEVAKPIIESMNQKGKPLRVIGWNKVWQQTKNTSRHT